MGPRTIGFGVRRSRSGTTNLGSRSGTTNRCCDCDRDRREGEVERRRLTAKSKGAIRSRMVKSKLNSSALWVRSLSRCDLSGRSLAGRRGGLSPSLFFLYLTLTQLSLSLSIFRKIVFEGKIKTKINLHPTHGQLKTISGKCIFHEQPNTRKYGKAFSEVIFTQNKHRVSFNIYHSKKKIDSTLNVLCFVKNK